MEQAIGQILRNRITIEIIENPSFSFFIYTRTFKFE